MRVHTRSWLCAASVAVMLAAVGCSAEQSRVAMLAAPDPTGAGTVTNLVVSGPNLLVEAGPSGRYIVSGSIAGGSSSQIFENVVWSTSSDAILQYVMTSAQGAGVFKPGRAGSARVTAAYGRTVASMVVLVERDEMTLVLPPAVNVFNDLNADFDAQISGVVNGCAPRAVHSSRDFTAPLRVGNLDAFGRSGNADLVEPPPAATIRYNALASRDPDTELSLTAFVDAYTYRVTLRQSPGNPLMLTGTETITGPGPCQATYNWRVQKR